MNFTFQSGYIPIKSNVVKTSYQSYFTFQSGHIPIKRKAYSGHVTKYLYIPILQTIDEEFRTEFLYIPIWSYSNSSAFFLSVSVL